ncbi:MAG: glycosyltransferase [Patescibacteria group bacterium]
MKIAFTYDRINKIGGAERVLTALHEIWPEAPIYTAVYSPKTAAWAKIFDVRTSFLQRIPFAVKNHEIFPWLTPMAFQQFDFSEYDVVLSVTSAEAKSCVTSPNTLHLCYCLTPTRYLWSHKQFYEADGIKGKVLSLLGPSLRIQDYITAQGVDQFVAISETVARRIKKYYGKSADIIYPPVTSLNKADGKHKNPVSEPYYLIVSRLVPYKRVDLALKACKSLGKRLVIVGQGSEERNLKKIADSSTIFTGELTDAELSRYYMHCKAVIFPAEEDFGIVPVEAQLYGKPVIAFGNGGARETVSEGKTGLFFYPQTEEALKQTIVKFEQMQFKQKDCRRNAARFTREKFKKTMYEYVTKAWQKFRKK